MLLPFHLTLERVCGACAAGPSLVYVSPKSEPENPSIGSAKSQSLSSYSSSSQTYTQTQAYFRKTTSTAHACVSSLTRSPLRLSRTLAPCLSTVGGRRMRSSRPSRRSRNCSSPQPSSPPGTTSQSRMSAAVAPFCAFWHLFLPNDLGKFPEGIGTRLYEERFQRARFVRFAEILWEHFEP